MENEEIMDINKLAGGAIQESIHYGLEEVFKNILDPNTEPEKARKLTITMELKPDESRQIIRTKTTCKTSLVPTNSITTQMLLGKEGEKIVATELLKHDPNQVSLDEYEEASNKIINLNKEVK
mgnify:CR=1 FL=1